jgi:hypothetical protein
MDRSSDVRRQAGSRRAGIPQTDDARGWRRPDDTDPARVRGDSIMVAQVLEWSQIMIPIALWMDVLAPIHRDAALGQTERKGESFGRLFGLDQQGGSVEFSDRDPAP